MAIPTTQFNAWVPPRPLVSAIGSRCIAVAGVAGSAAGARQFAIWDTATGTTVGTWQFVTPSGYGVANPLNVWEFGGKWWVGFGGWAAEVDVDGTVDYYTLTASTTTATAIVVTSTDFWLLRQTSVVRVDRGTLVATTVPGSAGPVGWPAVVGDKIVYGAASAGARAVSMTAGTNTQISSSGNAAAEAQTATVGTKVYYRDASANTALWEVDVSAGTVTALSSLPQMGTALVEMGGLLYTTGVATSAVVAIDPAARVSETDTLSPARGPAQSGTVVGSNVWLATAS